MALSLRHQQPKANESHGEVQIGAAAANLLTTAGKGKGQRWRYWARETGAEIGIGRSKEAAMEIGTRETALQTVAASSTGTSDTSCFSWPWNPYTQRWKLCMSYQWRPWHRAHQMCIRDRWRPWHRAHHMWRSPWQHGKRMWEERRRKPWSTLSVRLIAISVLAAFETS
ncbi:hypothetical protein E2562_027808 [Oryza meyeriana var. granulata]|uniref:Uncharacterized protein n=1 Tax=Oryza meyeriana var. granulata TaxID=110450 RepID=A0A6G1DPV8_9ORYZ|nr:hypothetical protein E2562_027808 [Oryza meyeriana var. granulata]